MATISSATRQFPDANGDPRSCQNETISIATPANGLVMAPKLCRKSDVAPWTLSDQGKKQKCRFALRRDVDVFFTCGPHDPKNEVSLDPTSNLIKFSAPETNCLGYALGRPKDGDVDIKLDTPSDKFRSNKVAIALLKAKKIKIMLAETLDFVLPLGSLVKKDYVAIDIWEGMGGGWHATRRAKVGTKSIIISKDGRNAPVENFDPSESLSTNAGRGYKATPMYTILVPEIAIGNWSMLGEIFS